jgi:hypothetical protein
MYAPPGHIYRYDMALNISTDECMYILRLQHWNHIGRMSICQETRLFIWNLELAQVTSHKKKGQPYCAGPRSSVWEQIIHAFLYFCV